MENVDNETMSIILDYRWNYNVYGDFHTIHAKLVDQK